MTTKKAAAVAPDPAATPIPTDGSAAAETTKKVKKERLFKPATDYSEIRKKEGQLSAKFNRVGRQVKALGLSAEAEITILGLIESEFQVQVKGVVAGTAPAAAAPAAELV